MVGEHGRRLGKVTAETFGNGLTGTHVWAASTGQAKQLQWKSGATTVESFNYSYDALGNLKSQLRGGVTESYTYDARQRLTGTSVSGGGSVSFAYSAAGNLLSKSDFSAGGNAYGYGANGCGPHGVSSVALPISGAITYACDANGNVIGGSALTATFDAENRPRTIVRSASGSGVAGGNDLIFRNGFEAASMQDPAGATDGNMSYAYDAKGGRYVEIAAGRTTRYGPNGYEKVISGTVTHRHELGPVVVARVGSTDTVSYMLRDRLGSTVAVSSAAGSLSERRQFDAFGKARNADFTSRPAGQANLTATNRGFTAHTQADDVWLVHMNGRVYDQNLGRFLSVDPVVQGGSSQSLNPYSYIQNNPLSGTDPSGYASQKDECAGTKSGGCTAADQEVKATRAATLTGSHIKGGSGGANIEVVMVNPTAGGMAELAVGMAGMSSGYVVQATSLVGMTVDFSSDIGSAAKRDHDGGASEDKDAPVDAATLRARLATAQTRLEAATQALNSVMDELIFPKFGSADEAQQWFQSFAQPITNKYGPEIGTNIITDGKDAYWLEDIIVSPNFSRYTGMGSTVAIRARPGDASRVAAAHTHPGVNAFSPQDIFMAVSRAADSYVSTTNGNSWKFSYGNYLKNGNNSKDWNGLRADPRFVTLVNKVP
ncbi:RHS repeat domain-containing protein [Tahibacter sp. UC22_41]|uniref:RHS repeat domain-containing protein n=1 Tax=Tahibacter sp. UC22_41 TaxID=3350178 RepID=UPI0036D9BCEA